MVRRTVLCKKTCVPIDYTGKNPKPISISKPARVPVNKSILGSDATNHSSNTVMANEHNMPSVAMVVGEPAVVPPVEPLERNSAMGNVNSASANSVNTNSLQDFRERFREKSRSNTGSIASNKRMSSHMNRRSLRNSSTRHHPSREPTLSPIHSRNPSAKSSAVKQSVTKSRKPQIQSPQSATSVISVKRVKPHSSVVSNSRSGNQLSVSSNLDNKNSVQSYVSQYSNVTGQMVGQDSENNFIQVSMFE